MSDSKLEKYDMLARLLTYPDDDYVQQIARGTEEIKDTLGHANEHLRKFSKEVEGLSLEEMQELFTRTFDINPVCALEVGWQIYGENYERGNFIVMMRKKMRELGLPESSELPDHLSHILMVLGRLSSDDAIEFASKFVAPAIEKMIAGMDGKNNPYLDVLLGIRLELNGKEINTK